MVSRPSVSWTANWISFVHVHLIFPFLASFKYFHVPSTCCSCVYVVLTWFFTSPLMGDAADASLALEVYFWQSQFPESKVENLKIKLKLNTKIKFRCEADINLMLLLEIDNLRYTPHPHRMVVPITDWKSRFNIVLEVSVWWV